jgi:hypothetical protein
MRAAIGSVVSPFPHVRSGVMRLRVWLFVINLGIALQTFALIHLSDPTAAGMGK